MSYKPQAHQGGQRNVVLMCKETNVKANGSLELRDIIAGDSYHHIDEDTL